MPALLIRAVPWVVGGAVTLWGAIAGGKALGKAGKAAGEGLAELTKVLLAVGGVALAVFAGFLALGKRRNNQPGLYQAGYLGMPAPDGRENDASYLAGRMKRYKDDQKNNILTSQGTALAGLKVEGVTATFGKPRGNYERY